MSKTTFDNVTRAALWHAHGNKCFYCNKPLDWNELHIDHIIPEIYSSRSLEMIRIIEDYNLKCDFSVNELSNLVPTHSICNQRKSSELFTKSTALYYFALTERILPKVQEEISKLKNRKNKGQLLSKLQIALENKIIDASELETILKKIKQDNWNSKEIELPFGIDFIDEVYSSFYLDSDFSFLYDRKMRIGGVYEYLELHHEIKKPIKVSTLREWRVAVKDEYFPMTNADIKMSSSFTFLEELIESLEKAKMPQVSFVSEPWIGLSNLEYLSPDILHYFENPLPDFQPETSIADLVSSGDIIKNESSIYQISLEFGGMETSLIEQFRADFDGDGIEEIFVRGWARAVGGTLGYSFTTTLKRNSFKSLIRSAL